MISFHNQAMVKQQIYEKRIERQTGMDYSTGIHFWKSLVNMDKSKTSTKSNRTEEHMGKAVSAQLHQALMDYLQGFPCGGCFLEGQNIGLADDNISIWGKEVRIRSIRGGRGRLSDGRGGWGECRTRIRISSGGIELFSEGQGIWGIAESGEGASAVRVELFLEA